MLTGPSHTPRRSSGSLSSAKVPDPGDASKAPAPDDDLFETGRQQLRDTLKWMLASFGAIGAALALGGLVSNLGKQSGLRLAIGILGGSLAFAGVFLALWLAVKILTGSHVTLGELASESRKKKNPDAKVSFLVDFFETGNPQVLGGYATIAELDDNYLEAVRSHDTATIERIGSLVRQLVNIASFEQLRHYFNEGITKIVWSLAFAAVGILLFASAVKAPEEATTPAAAFDDLPVAVSVSLTSTGRDLLSDDLGKKCASGDIPALAIGSADGATDVVTLPTPDCAITRFTVTNEIGTVLPAEPVCVVSESSQASPALRASPSETPSEAPSETPVVPVCGIHP
jgi:hypothetical protein